MNFDHFYHVLSILKEISKLTVRSSSQAFNKTFRAHTAVLLPQVSSSCNDCGHHPRYASSPVSSAIADLSEKGMAKQLQTPFATHWGNAFLLKNYGCESFNFSRTHSVDFCFPRRMESSDHSYKWCRFWSVKLMDTLMTQTDCWDQPNMWRTGV